MDKTEKAHRKEPLPSSTGRRKVRDSLPVPAPILKALFGCLDEQLEPSEYDYTLRHVRDFIRNRALLEDPIVRWLVSGGGYCDCEALANACGRQGGTTGEHAQPITGHGGRDWSLFGEKLDHDRQPSKIWLLNAISIPIKRHIKITGDANPYNPAYETYFEQHEAALMRASFQRTRILRFPWYEHYGLCPACNLKITSIAGWRLHLLVFAATGLSAAAMLIPLGNLNPGVSLKCTEVQTKEPDT